MRVVIRTVCGPELPEAISVPGWSIRGLPLTKVTTKSGLFIRVDLESSLCARVVQRTQENISLLPELRIRGSIRFLISGPVSV